MIEVKAYSCDYCAMTSRNKGCVKRHEINSCRKNPNRKTCVNCKNLDFDDPQDGYFCDKIDSHIYHPLNMNMSECKFYES